METQVFYIDIHMIRVDKSSSFSGQYPTRPETRSLGAGQGGAGIL